MTKAKTKNPRIAEMLRVDHAGEYAAVAIYKGQKAVFGANPKTQHMAVQLQDMQDEEQKHLDAFDKLLVEREVRPTAMTPIWNVAGYGLGVVTALMGEKAAHACTEAVETVIEQHYDAQSKEIAEEEPELSATFREFREDELHHRDIALEGGAKEAPAYGLLSGIIRAGCLAAIRITEKV
ncbi:ubiquinone biosynthesis monooxygenase Coq7 [Litorimonas taeanensis]|uniref:3-demethoxyubiquinol 3-hydroxylase n=1 Tax=Litorimonas taeanensis TaxID=568099 RepID=A0A420WD62_9PROT|nr:demethoxyubiquinone hydroxylase family protein [Litorimonas taeanensis]RKQ68895.1 ubiquinone biosynthesis monooxygenase Coq7 [Litorimonas taeanensis]